MMLYGTRLSASMFPDNLVVCAEEHKRLWVGEVGEVCCNDVNGVK